MVSKRVKVMTNAFATLTAVRKADLITGAPRAVLYALALAADGESGKNAYPSISTLAKESGVTNATVRRAIDTLRTMRVIQHTGDKKGRSGGKPVKVWAVLHDRLATWSSDNEASIALKFRNSPVPNRSGRAVPTAHSEQFQPLGVSDDLPLNLPLNLPYAKASPDRKPVVVDRDDLVAALVFEADHYTHPTGYDLYEEEDAFRFVEDLMERLAADGITNPLAYITGRMAAECELSWALAVCSLWRRNAA